MSLLRQLRFLRYILNKQQIFHGVAALSSLKKQQYSEKHSSKTQEKCVNAQQIHRNLVGIQAGGLQPSSRGTKEGSRCAGESKAAAKVVGEEASPAEVTLGIGGRAVD